MKEIAMVGPGNGAVRKKRALIDEWARRSVFGELAKLRGGQLIVEDEEGCHRLGQGGDLVARIRVWQPDFFRRVLFGGTLGAAESYMEGGWTTDDLSTTLRLFARDLVRSERMEGGWGRLRSLAERGFHALRRNTLGGSASNIHAHYDLGNDLFELFLDGTMSYSAGVFEGSTDSMKDASVAKMDRICRKLDLRPDDHLLEIGSGWGGFAIHAASNYGCRVTTTTVSAEQHALAIERVRERGLESHVRVLLEDYRELSGTYDKLVSIEMIEAVGHQYLDTYFETCGKVLKPTGLMLLQAITTPEYRYEDSRRSVDFIRRYIFPGSCLTSVGQMSAAIGRRTDFRILHVEDIGPHYAETLRRWRRRFSNNLDRVRQLGYDEHFVRMWEYYLCYCEAGFEERIVGDVQMLLARPDSRHAPVLGTLHA